MKLCAAKLVADLKAGAHNLLRTLETEMTVNNSIFKRYLLTWRQR